MHSSLVTNESSTANHNQRIVFTSKRQTVLLPKNRTVRIFSWWNCCKVSQHIQVICASLLCSSILCISVRKFWLIKISQVTAYSIVKLKLGHSLADCSSTPETAMPPVHHTHILFDCTFQKKFNTNIEHTKYMLTVSKTATELFPRGHAILIQLCGEKFCSAAPLPSNLSAHPWHKGPATAQPECEFELQLWGCHLGCIGLWIFTAKPVFLLTRNCITPSLGSATACHISLNLW